jgi:glutaredoxin
MYYFIVRETPRCVYCEMAKQLAEKAGLDFKTFSVEEADIREFMDLNNIRSVPAVFKDSVSMENFIGGATEFQKHVYSR